MSDSFKDTPFQSKKKMDINKINSKLTDTASHSSLLLKSEYGIKGDRTDTVSKLQTALNDIAAKYKKLVFPPNTTYFIDTPLLIPSNFHIDFNGATIYGLNDMDVDTIQLQGSNITLENLTLIEENHNYGSDADGIALKLNQNVDNIKLKNIKTSGFFYGIRLEVQNGFVASNIIIKDCTTNYASFAGLNTSNVKNVFISKLTALYNKLDGLKLGRNATNVDIDGVNCSYNGINGVYADGIDIYAGGNKVIIRGAVCEYNVGVGIHVLSGELNDPTYPQFYGSYATDILIADSFCNYNGDSGLDAITKTTVSTNTPHPSNININNCMFIGNAGLGASIISRHLTMTNCTAKLNGSHGINIQNSRYIELIGFKSIANSQTVAGQSYGIRIVGSKYVKVLGGFINGADSNELQNEDETGLTVYHAHGVHIEDASSCDDIYISKPTILNYTGLRAVYVTNTTGSSNSRIIVELGDIGADNTNSYYAYLGSTLYKGGRQYRKNTLTGSNVWDLILIERNGITAFTSLASQISYTIPHGLGVTPTKFNAVLRLQADTKLIEYITVDATNLYVKLNAAPTTGTNFSIHWAAAY